MTAELGHFANRSYYAQDGTEHLNGGKKFNTAEREITPHLEDIGQITVYTAAGAITQKAGLVALNAGSGIAMTLADPVSGDPGAGGDDGKRLTIVSQTAQAHTVSNAAGSGFNGAGASFDVGTYGAAIGNAMDIYAQGGKWWTRLLTGVTLG